MFKIFWNKFNLNSFKCCKNGPTYEKIDITKKIQNIVIIVEISIKLFQKTQKLWKLQCIEIVQM